jgi:BirA family biotin operon repressor/biotin-[acetyl-CoA-carboxylase] ligase
LSNSKPLPEGTVIMAETQLAGRGQTQNIWKSEPHKNLTFSILLNPGFLAVQRQFDLNIVISLALNDVLKNYFGDSAEIKWPNDCYVMHKKLGGILIENLVQGNQIKHAIIGIGLNVNQINFPSELINVTSFKKILQTDYDLNILKDEICGSIEARYLQLKAGKYPELLKAYRKKLYLFDVLKDFKIDDRIQKARICGITSEGFLQVETEKGLRTFGLKEIEFIKN